MAKGKKRPLSPPIDMKDWKWRRVRRHYESVYHVEFKKRPDDYVVHELYRKIHVLNADFENYLKENPELADKLK